MQALSRFIFFKILKWNLIGAIDPAVKKCVIIVAPHTSWYDFFLGLLVRSILGIKSDFVGKKELFRPPFGWYFKWVGGTPLDRTPNQDKVQAITAIFKKRETFRLALSPEGTRKKTERWKTGFYYIAEAAKVPIIKVAFDYANKEVKVAPPFYTSGNIEKDLVEIQQFYKGVKGKKPENF